MDRHVRALGWINICAGAGGAVFGILSLLWMDRIVQFLLAFSSRRLADTVPASATYLTLLSAVLLIAAFPAILSGFGLLRYAGWARYIAIPVALLDVLAVPIGTPIGLYALWVLLSEETEYLFLEPPRRTGAAAHR
jgi:hypothetical protein